MHVLLRVKNESQWIERCINSFINLSVDKVIILDDGSIDNTGNIIHEKISSDKLLYKYQLLPLDEVRDKNWLYSQAIEFNSDWILSLDGDEEISLSSGEEIEKIIFSNNYNCPAFGFFFLFIWKIEKDREWFRVDKKFFPNYHPRLYKLKSVPNYKNYSFSSSLSGGFHCGSIPNTIKYSPANILIKHYGYSSKELRRKKYNWYKTIDNKTNYEHLIDEKVTLLEFNNNMNAKNLGLLQC